MAAQVHWFLYDDHTGQIHPHEPLEHYVLGGLQSAAIGDSFRDTCYTVLRKVGCASDDSGIQSGPPSRNFVSINIKRASSSDAGLDADPEVMKLKTLKNIWAANVVFTCNSISDVEDDDLFEALSDLYVAKAKGPLPSSNLPKETVAKSRWGLWDDGPEESIRLIDWGAAFPVDQIPLELRAPETFFVSFLNYKFDLWRAECVEPIFMSRYYDKNFFLEQEIEKLGSLPTQWRSKFRGHTMEE
ncbi:hypothetical protein N8I77_002785 [Diaporthe amygdali]|uniref:Uncharacterized protein n=1 Tax=Phomopsis amygdali TaxID=1214568 RepID=A0AAD9STP3_PHOAM|nr:hypothetical protein N8I77_002785 [Diaporthe amygdali]